MNRSNVNFLRHKIKIKKKNTAKKSQGSSVIRLSYGIVGVVFMFTSVNLSQEQEKVAKAIQAPVVEVVKQEVVETNDLESKNINRVQDVKKKVNDDVMLVLNTDQFFQLGTARIVDEKVPELNEIVGALKASVQNFGEGAALEIESHTDDSPVVKQKHLYQSNWELSAARAASLVHLFEEAGFSKEKMKLVGYGDSRPVVPNRDPSGEQILTNAVKNRRIVLRVYHADQEKNSI
jgi:chemotaxis protein MotB